MAQAPKTHVAASFHSPFVFHACCAQAPACLLHEAQHPLSYCLPNAGEDDGFLLVYVYKSAEDTSYFTVSMRGGTLA